MALVVILMQELISGVWSLDIYDNLACSGTFNSVPLTTAGTGGLNPTLTPIEIGEIGGLMHFGDFALATHTAPLGGAASDYSAAVQIAIWSIEYESVALAYTNAPVCRYEPCKPVCHRYRKRKHS